MRGAVCFVLLCLVEKAGCKARLGWDMIQCRYWWVGKGMERDGYVYVYSGGCSGRLKGRL